MHLSSTLPKQQQSVAVCVLAMEALNFLLHKYEDAISMAYGYLKVIYKPNMLPTERVLSHLIPENTI